MWCCLVQVVVMDVAVIAVAVAAAVAVVAVAVIAAVVVDCGVGSFHLAAAGAQAPYIPKARVVALANNNS